MTSSTPKRRPRPRKASACQRVGGTPCDKIAKPDSFSSEAGHGSKCDEPLLWPESIPVEERVSLLSGHRSFVTGKQVLSPQMLRGKVIDLKGHVILAGDGGRLLIERDDHRLIIESGQSCLLSNTRFTLSELPAKKGGGGIFYAFFFPDEVLAKAVPTGPRTTSLVCRSINFPCLDGIIPLRNHFPLRHRCPTTGVRGLLDRMLLSAFNELNNEVWRLCAKQVVLPRIRIQLFLENLLLRPLETHEIILDQYPGGKRAILREMGHLAMPSIATILDERRMELCSAWLNYGQRSFEEITKALHITQPGRFIARFERWVVEKHLPIFPSVKTDSYEGTLVAAHPQFLPSIRGQYWHLREEEDARARDLQRLATDASFRLLRAHAEAVVAEDPSLLTSFPFVPLGSQAASPIAGEVDADFWEMKSTGAAMVLRAEGLTEIPGLEDVADLLLAA